MDSKGSATLDRLKLRILPTTCLRPSEELPHLILLDFEAFCCCFLMIVKDEGQKTKQMDQKPRETDNE